MSPVRLLKPQDLVDDRRPEREELVAQANAFSARFGAPCLRLVKPQLSRRSARVRSELVREHGRLDPAA